MTRTSRDKGRGWAGAGLLLGVLFVLGGRGLHSQVHALGGAGAVEVRRVSAGAGSQEPHPRAAQRIAWEVRKRTSVETTLEPTQTTLDDPSIFRTPLLYWASDHAFAELSAKQIAGLRRFVEYGGFLIIDDAAPEAGGFDASVRRALSRAFPAEPLVKLPADHTIYRSFYLLDRPVGRLDEPDSVEAIMHAGRAAVVYSRHDLGGAWAELSSGASLGFSGGSYQRELAIRFGVNLVMYALCLDYKDDQVHAPFILRRRAGRP